MTVVNCTKNIRYSSTLNKIHLRCDVMHEKVMESKQWCRRSRQNLEPVVSG